MLTARPRKLNGSRKSGIKTVDNTLPPLRIVIELLQLIEQDHPDSRRDLEASDAYAALVDWLRRNFYDPTVP
jgi:hypothetical protein